MTNKRFIQRTPKWVQQKGFQHGGGAVGNPFKSSCDFKLVKGVGFVFNLEKYR